MKPFRFVRNMQEWVFSTATRSVEIINIVLLAHLSYTTVKSGIHAISPQGFPVTQLDLSIAGCVFAAMAASQFAGLFSDDCSRCRKFSGLLLAASAIVWLTVAAFVYIDCDNAALLGIGAAYSSVYSVVALLCYLAAEVISEYIKVRMGG